MARQEAHTHLFRLCAAVQLGYQRDPQSIIMKSDCSVQTACAQCNSTSFMPLICFPILLTWELHGNEQH